MWVKNNPEHPDFWYCSICNEEAYWDTDYGQQLFDYCPHCGAYSRIPTEMKQEKRHEV